MVNIYERLKTAEDQLRALTDALILFGTAQHNNVPDSRDINGIMLRRFRPPKRVRVEADSLPSAGPNPETIPAVDEPEAPGPA